MDDLLEAVLKGLARLLPRVGWLAEAAGTAGDVYLAGADGKNEETEKGDAGDND